MSGKQGGQGEAWAASSVSGKQGQAKSGRDRLCTKVRSWCVGGQVGCKQLGHDVAHDVYGLLEVP